MPSVASQAGIILLLLLDVARMASFQPSGLPLSLASKRGHQQNRELVCHLSTPNPVDSSNSSKRGKEKNKRSIYHLENKRKLPKKKKKKRKERKLEDYQRRREQWLERYGSLEALQSTFGAGPPWGDLTPEQTRRLYHTLLPRSLLGLYEMGVMQPDELAPLAYEARVAAKEYARSRSLWTGKLVTAVFDGYRKMKKIKKGDKSSVAEAEAPLTWEAIFAKYEAQIAAEEEQHAAEEDQAGHSRRKKKDDEDDVTMRIYKRILERSVETNRAFDSLFLKNKNHSPDESDELERITAKLEKDVRDILLHPRESEKIMEREEKARKKEQKSKEKAEKKQRKEEEKRRKEEEKT